MIPLLGYRTWRDLRALARTLYLPFASAWTVAEARSHLTKALLTSGLKRSYRQLSDRERAALAQLQRQGQPLPAADFTAVYGSIHSQWHRRNIPPEDKPSSAQILWDNGWIERIPGKPTQIALPDEALPFLPPLPPEPPPQWMSVIPANALMTLERDLAAFLSVLLAADVRLLHGRWLPRWALRAVNRRLAVPLTEPTTELRADYLRCLHYLADASGLISVQHEALKPTASAWAWLESYQRLEWLRAALAQDEAQRIPRRDAYRLSASAPWLQALSNHLPTQATPIIPAQSAFNRSGLWVALSPAPPLRALVEAWAWVDLDETRFLLDDAAVQRALAQGCTAETMAGVLAELCDGVSNVTLEWLTDCEQRARRICLRHVQLLTVADTDTMAALRKSRALRPLLGDLLSPHHCLVQPQANDHLRTALERRGLSLCQTIDTPHRTPKPDADSAAYLYLAARVYQGLQRWVKLPVPAHNGLFQSLRGQLSPAEADYLDQTAERLLETLATVRAGFRAPPGFASQATVDQTSAALRDALDARQPITFDYFSPAYGKLVRRTVEPLLMDERNGVLYLEAYCRLDEAPRTFRVDRIMNVYSTNVSPLTPFPPPHTGEPP